MPEYDEDAVGYQSPPKRNQFRKGQSGNPKGRPRKAEGIEDYLPWLLAWPIRARDTGEEVTVFSALVRTLHRLVLNGDLQAMKLMERVTRMALKYNLIDLPPAPRREDPYLKMNRIYQEILAEREEEEEHNLCPEGNDSMNADENRERQDE